MTLGELLKDKELPVKVRSKNMAANYFFEVTHKNHNWCLGILSSGIHTADCLFGSEYWELYVEPKKTKTVYEYLVEINSHDYYCVEWYESDEQFKLNNPNKPIIKTGRSHTFEVE